jgi:hypothetical protein
MTLADAEAGNGFCVIDRHGDLAERVLARLPRHGRDDVILFDPVDTTTKADAPRQADLGFYRDLGIAQPDDLTST